MPDCFQPFQAENADDCDQVDQVVADTLCSAAYVDDIPSWERAKRDKSESDRILEAEKKAAEHKAALLLEERRVALLLEKAVGKAVEAGDIPKVAAEEFKKVPCPRGVGELVRKIAEKHGAEPSLTMLDFEKAGPFAGLGHAQVSYKVAGADEKLSKMSAEDAIAVLKNWVGSGKNPLAPGGALEQTLYVTRYCPPPVNTTTCGSLGPFNFKFPEDSYKLEPGYGSIPEPEVPRPDTGASKVPSLVDTQLKPSPTSKPSFTIKVSPTPTRMPSPFRKQTI